MCPTIIFPNSQFLIHLIIILLWEKAQYQTRIANMRLDNGIPLLVLLGMNAIHYTKQLLNQGFTVEQSSFVIFGHWYQLIILSAILIQYI